MILNAGVLKYNINSRVVVGFMLFYAGTVKYRKKFSYSGRFYGGTVKYRKKFSYWERFLMLFYVGIVKYSIKILLYWSVLCWHCKVQKKNP